MDKAFVAFIAFSNPEACEDFAKKNKLHQYYEPQCIMVEWKDEHADGKRSMDSERGTEKSTTQGG